MGALESETDARTAAWLVLAIAIAVRVAAAALVPLAPDETYYWEWSRRLAAGYLDHPPMIALFVRAGTALLGNTPLGVRLGSLVAGALASAVLVRISSTLGGARAMLRASAIIACMPLAQLGLALATPDAPLLLFWALALAALAAALRTEGTPRARLAAWALFGIAAGCALASKYTAVLLLASVAVALVALASVRRSTSWSGPLLALVLAIAVFTPNAIWNARHGWVTLAFQLSHGLAQHRGTAIGHEARLLGSQLGLVSPLLFALLARAVLASLRDRSSALRTTFAIVAALTWTVFVLTALRTAAEPNWQAPAYLAAIVLAAISPRPLPCFRSALALGATITLVIYAHAISPFLPADPALDPTGDGHGWRELAAHVSAARADAPPGVTAWIAGERYQEASELAYHLPDHPTTFTIDVNARANQYQLWPSFAQRAHRGDRLVLVLGLYTSPDRDEVIAALRPHFESVALRETVALRRGSILRASRRIWVLDGWRGSWPEHGLVR